ncbi:MAG: PEBP family protein [Pseudomonadota bacterium]
MRHAAPLALLIGLAFVATPGHAFLHKPPPRDGSADLNESQLATPGTTAVTGEVWVDNWFKLWLDGAPLLEDSVPITTERSFNAERFRFNADLPAVLAFEFRDFMENDTGLEYIGTRRQQMGDGGAIAQFSVGGQVIAATDANTKCLVVQHAPVQTSCAADRNPVPGEGPCAADITARPEGWAMPGYDDNDWADATEHSAAAVGPKDGYDRITWDRAAKLIWGPDLKRDNVLLCRITLGR